MPLVHAIVGSLLIVANAAVALWGFIAYRRNAPPGEVFRQMLALAQTLVIAQATLGLMLISEGYRPGDRLHFVYGLLPLLASPTPMLCAVKMGGATCCCLRSDRRSSQPWASARS